jgi:asparagine synthase (glutamine-hydrolysing)
MFAYLASHNSRDTGSCTVALGHLAEKYGVPSSNLRKLVFPNFQLDFFDTGDELQYYKDERHILLLSGALLNKESIQSELDSSTNNDAELIFRLYQSGRQSLNKVDGHLSFVLFDAEKQKISLMGDRFHRYSVVYSVSDASYASSHSSLLYPFLNDQTFDMKSFSQSIQFRWLTGHRRLFAEVHQVLPGSLTHIDEYGKTQREAYFRVAFRRETNLDQEYWVQQVDAALDSTLSQIAQKHDAIGIPLSGGVDSSLLLAKANEHFKDCVAVTARFLNGENPELENARYFAKELGVRHVIVDIDDDYIRDIFPRIIGLHEQPPRNYSDIALGKTLQTISTQVGAFLYGEAADTFFGVSNVHSIVAANKKAEAFRLLPKSLQKLAAKLIPESRDGFLRLKKILGDSIDALVYSIEEIGYVTPPWQVFPCSKKPSSDRVLNEYLAHEKLPVGDRVALQLLSTGVMNHIENTGRLATFYGLQMYVPFVLNDVRSVAVRLPFELQNVNGVYKKVLRELACRYFDRNVVHSKKYGFPTPSKNWLDGPLRERVMRSSSGAGEAKQYYSPDVLSSLSIEEDFEHFWFAICLDEILSQVKKQSRMIPVAV